MKKNIIITDGLGQNEQILINLLKNRKINLTIFYRNKKPQLQDNSKVNFIKENLLTKKKLDVFFSKKKPDIVLHLAENNPAIGQNNYNKYFKENILATKNIFYSTYKANKKAKFIFCSSSQIFKKKKGIVNEKSKILISSDYTKFRIKSDSIMIKYKKKENIKYTNAILFNHDSKFRNTKFLFPRIVNGLINKKYLFLNNIIKENIYADFSHAEDICNGLYKIMFSTKNFDKIILSSGKCSSVNDIIKYIIFKNKIKINLNFGNSEFKKGLIGNNHLARNELNWYPKNNIYNAVNDLYVSKNT